MLNMLSRTLACGIAACALLSADTLVTKDGRTVHGTYVGGDARLVRITVGDRVETFNVANVAEIRFGGDDYSAAPPRDRMAPPPQDAYSQTSPPSAPPQDAYSQAPPPRRERADMRQDRDYSRQDAPPPAGHITIPAGTNIVVRMIDGVDSEKSALGQTYRASIDEPVIVDGNVVIPRGADVIAKLVEAKQSGKFEGRTELTLDLQSVAVNGDMVDLTTQSVTQASDSRTARTGKVVGGTAALGAIIGALAGGGKGAAIGATSGAAVGAGAQIATKGQRVRIPSETRLTFVLQQPATL